MKHQIILPLACCLLAGTFIDHSAVAALQPKAGLKPVWTEPQTVERGPHHRVVRRMEQVQQPDGQIIERAHTYTELETGMHYFDKGQWRDSEALIELSPNGALAAQGAHQVFFAADIRTAGAIDLFTPEGERMRSHVLGLAYVDAASGQSVLFAEVKSALGEILPPNQVIYRNAFTDIKADLRYTYTKAGFEQDVIMRETPPSPKEFGLDPATTRLEVWTEFLEAPQPAKAITTLRGELDPLKRQAMRDPDFKDQSLGFGVMRIGSGRAFSENAVADSEEKPSAPVGKSWEQIEGRTFLIEAVEYPTVKIQLEALPKQAALPGVKVNNMAKVKPSLPGKAVFARAFPPAPGIAPAPGKMKQTASVNPPTSTFVLDYLIAASATNFTFAADTTYYVKGTVNLSGTTVFEGGTVIKYTNYSTAVKLALSGPIDCQTAPYRPAVFTAKDDDTVGAIISGSTGVPIALTNNGSGTSKYYGIYAISLGANTTNILHDMRFSYMLETIDGNGRTGPNGIMLDLSNAQFNYCQRVVDYLNASLHNVLIDHCYSPFYYGTFSGENITHHDLHYLQANLGQSTTNYFTNSLFVRVTNSPAITGESNVVLSSDSGVFNPVVGGRYYLATNSPYRNIGKTNITAQLALDLKRQTTYAPAWLTNAISVSTNLPLAAIRDTDTPDLGYHYVPLDYIASGATITSNATVTVSNGVAVGVDYSLGSWGIIFDSGKLVSTGTALQHNWLVRAYNVQEWSTGNPGTRAWLYDQGYNSSKTNEAHFRFADMGGLADDGVFLNTGQGMAAMDFTHCELYTIGITNTSSLTNGQSFGMTNCLMKNTGFALKGDATASVHFRNLLLKSANFQLPTAGTNWSMRDCLFDVTYLNDYGNQVSNSYNGYLSMTNQLTGSTNSVVLTNLTYQTGALGSYYIPTNSTLVDAGSRYATNAGLYHFTMTTNQVKEAATLVDIGYHYVAVDANGNPIDTDGDGIADYLEDQNGNGATDAGESDFTLYSSAGDGFSDYLKKQWGVSPSQYWPNDTNNVVNLRTYTPLKP